MTDAIQSHAALAPTTSLEDGEVLIARFSGDKSTYWREHAWLAAFAMALGMGVLWAIGNPHVWTGAIGGLAAIAVRAFYLAADEVKTEWHLTNRRLLGPGSRAVTLDQVETVRSLFSAVQTIDKAGHKYLMKYQADPASVVVTLQTARDDAQRQEAPE